MYHDRLKGYIGGLTAPLDRSNSGSSNGSGGSGASGGSAGSGATATTSSSGYGSVKVLVLC